MDGTFATAVNVAKAINKSSWKATTAADGGVIDDSS